MFETSKEYQQKKQDLVEYMTDRAWGFILALNNADYCQDSRKLEKMVEGLLGVIEEVEIKNFNKQWEMNAETNTSENYAD